MPGQRPAARRGRRAVLLVLSVGTLAFAGAAGLAVPRAPRATLGAETIPTAALREWVIESFDVQVRVRRSGRIDVTETIRPRFTGSYNGIFRTIPIRYRDAQNFTYALALDVDEVTDGSGNELRYEESREGHNKKIKVWVPGAADATRTVQIRYSDRQGYGAIWHNRIELFRRKLPAFIEMQPDAVFTCHEQILASVAIDIQGNAPVTGYIAFSQPISAINCHKLAVFKFK